MAGVRPSARSLPRAQPVKSPPARPAPVAAAKKTAYDAYRDEQEDMVPRKDSKGAPVAKVDAYKGQSYSEKGIRMICEELMDLQKVSADDMRKSVIDNYTIFIRTSQEISELEGEISAMGEMLQSQAALVRTLAESGASIPSSAPDEPLSRDYFKDEVEPSDLVKQTESLPVTLDVLVAERKVDDALALLDEGEDLVARFQKENGVSEDIIRQLEKNLADRRAGLAAYLVQAVQHPSVRGLQLRSAISGIDRLGDGAHAHALLLQSHEERLKFNMNSLRQNETSYGATYTTAISQMVFSAIAQASRDSVAVFDEVPAYASDVVLWAEEVTEMCASVIKRNVLVSSAAAGGLRAAVECVQIALGHCALLKERGFNLCPTLSKLIRPSVEQALKVNLTSILENVGSLAAVDNWTLDLSPQRAARGAVSNLRLTSSGHRFLLLMQDFLEDLPALVSIQLGGAALEGVGEIFEQYMYVLIKALPNQEIEEEGERKVQMAASEDQQLSLLGNAAALADELVSVAASKLLPGGGGPQVVAGESRAPRPSTLAARSPELKELRRQLQMHVETLKIHLCNGIIIKLCYDDDGSKLIADTYLQIDSEMPQWHENPLPTALFQSIFQKLVSIQQVAGRVLVGKERVTQLFLIRLTETFVRDMNMNGELWGPIEEDPGSLGPLGLQQYIFDMQFLTMVAKNFGFLSRTVFQVIFQEEERMKEQYMMGGADLDSALPDPEWLQTAVHDSFVHLMDEWFGIGGYAPRDVSDVQSVSSLRSE